MEKGKRFAVLVGTSHRIQLGQPGAGEPSPDQFFTFLLELCDTHGIQGVGEEMSEDGLRRRNAEDSIPRTVARLLRLPHRFCDPSEELQRSMGIEIMRTPEDQQSVSIQFLGRDADQGYESRFRENEAKKERHWVEQVMELNRWPLLFICGSLHTPFVKDLLKASEIETIFTADRWGELA